MVSKKNYSEHYDMIKNIHSVSHSHIVILLVYHHFGHIYILFCFTSDNSSIRIERSKNKLKTGKNEEEQAMLRHGKLGLAV